VVKAIPEIPILVGAGVKNAQDVKVSLKRGAKGFVISSAVVLADNPKQVLEDLIKGFK
jgi:triosephosphate isomerase